MLDQVSDLVVWRLGGERDGRLLACVARGVQRVFGIHPLPVGDEAGQRARQLGEQRLARRHWQIGPRHQRFADRRQIAEAVDDAVDGERCDVGLGIFQER